MPKSLIRRSITAVLSAAMVLTSLSFGSGFTAHADPVPDSLPIPNDAYYRKETLQPYASNFQVDELKHWNPSGDPDARYNRSNVPLKERYMGPTVNDTASTEAKVVSLAYDPGGGKSTGGDSATAYAFTNFQYLDVLNYWGGSTSTGPISAPSPEYIAAAHRNGVAVTGTIFFPWDDVEFTTKAMTQFTEQDADGNFIIADKLIELADYYGFEGWFINQETRISVELAQKLRAMMAYMKEKRPDLLLQWYDSMISEAYDNGNWNIGAIWNQNHVNNYNIGMVQEGDTRYSDQIFLNFNWSDKSYPDTSISWMEWAGRSPFDILSTWENFPYSKDPGRVSFLIGDDGKIRTSLGFLAATNTLVSAASPEDFQNNTDLRQWVNASNDPRISFDPDNDSEFPGVATVIADKTPITGTNFVTHFTTGNGKKFYENGAVVRTREWYNRTMTDVMPTWKWIVDNTNASLQPEIDYSDAYWAGTSLKVAGGLDAGGSSHVKLYSSKLDITSLSTLDLVYKASDEGVMQLGLCFGDGSSYADSNFVFIDLNGKDIGNGWKEATVNLSQHAGKTAYAISLKFSSAAAIPNYSVNVGKLAITTDISAPGSVTKVTLDEYMFSDASHAEARLYWNAADGADYYKVYRIKADGSREMIGAVPNNAYYVSSFEQYGKEDGFDFEVVPITMYGTEGGSAKTRFTWDRNETGGDLVETPLGDSGPNIAAGKPAVANINNRDVNGKDLGTSFPGQLTDGLKDRSHKWCIDSGSSEESPHIATIDLGENMTIARYVAYHANNPDSAEAWTFNTDTFEVLYAADDGEEPISGDDQASRDRIYNSGMQFTSINKVEGNRKDITNYNLETPIQARYIQIKVTNSDNCPWHATRLPEFEVYSKPGKSYEKLINPENVYIQNNVGKADVIQIKNVSVKDLKDNNDQYWTFKTTIRIYESLEAAEPLKTVEPDENGIVTVKDLALNPEGGVLYFTQQDPLSGLDESLRFGIRYGAEGVSVEPVIDIPEATAHLSAESGETFEKDGETYYYGTVVIKDIPVGARAKFFSSRRALFPDIVSSVAQEVRLMRNLNAKIVQESVPLNILGGDIWVEIWKGTQQISERFPLEYGSIGELSIDMTPLEDLVAQYGGRIEAVYESGYPEYKTAMDAAEEALANGITGGDYDEKLQKLEELCTNLRNAVRDMVVKEGYRLLSKAVDPENMSEAVTLYASNGTTEIADATVGDTVIVDVQVPDGYEFTEGSISIKNGSEDVAFETISSARSTSPGAAVARIAEEEDGIAAQTEGDTLASARYSFVVPRGDRNTPITISVTLEQLPQPNVISVKVTPETISVEQGRTQKFEAEVEVENGASTDVLWSVSGNTDNTTVIDVDGLLRVGENETASTLTVTAKAKDDSEKQGTATVTVLEKDDNNTPDPKPPVTPSRPSTGGSSGGSVISRTDENWIFVRAQGMGTVTPGDCTVYDGDDKTFTFTPDTGYKVGKVLLDGEEVQTDGKSYTLRNITNPHTLTVIFVSDTAAESDASKPSDSIKPDATPNAPTGVETPSLALLLGVILMGGYFLTRRARSVRKH